jgi:hypothetical protein
VFILDHPETNDFGFVENCINGHLARAQIDPKPNEETVIDDLNQLPPQDYEKTDGTDLILSQVWEEDTGICLESSGRGV